MKTTTILFLALASFAATASPPPSAPPPEDLAPGVTLLRGAMLPGRGPDGNTVVFDAPDGLVVVDTGRHAWHSDAILALARERGRPIAAIVNTHWHLDHSSGNGRLKAAHPAARIHTTDAVDRALGEGGFLARNLASAEAMLEDPKTDELQKEEIRIFIATMQARQDLRPDVAVDADGRRAIGGGEFELFVTDGAVTDADLWLYDPAARVAVIGDLVTFPAPFFETACPARWREELDAVRALPFATVVPGHGEPMTRAQFDAWRAAFNGFLDCTGTSAPAAQCAAGWEEGIAGFLGADEGARKAARAYAEYYVGLLRDNGGKSADCRAS